MRTTVVNINVEKCDVYIGRGTQWGNPYVLGRDGTRAEVIAKFDKLMRGWSDEKRQNARTMLKGKKLGCHCKPSACHGDLLASLAESE